MLPTETTLPELVKLRGILADNLDFLSKEVFAKGAYAMRLAQCVDYSEKMVAEADKTIAELQGSEK